jgi:hypothetical protein
MTSTAVRLVRRSRERGKVMLAAAARSVGFGVRSSRDDQDEEQQDRAIHNGNAPFPFTNCKLILGREFSKGTGTH